MFDIRPRGFLLRPVLLSLLCILILVPLAHGQAQIKVNDNINLRFGLLAQGWADIAQDATTKNYANNLFLRRIRFIVGGQLSPNISFFFETDNPNDGKAPKALGNGFITQDAFLEWKPNGSTAFMVDAGLMLPPLCRNCLESAATILSLDYGSFSFTESAATQSVVGRDTGFLAKGYLAGGHFEYRAGIFNGFRAAGARNAFRETARLSYNPWDTESGYVYPGVYLGNKKVLQFGGGLDHQQDYKAYSVDGFISLPMGGGPAGGAPTTPAPPAPARNAVNAEVTLLAFDGGKTFTAIPEQKAATAQLGYYVAGLKVMPFVRLEKQDFRATANNGRDNNRQQVGLTWFPNGHNFNIKGAYSRVDPRAGNTTNEFTIQMQFFYY
jgi:hypothetical protein